MPPTSETGPQALYQAILLAWNLQDADRMANQFTSDATLVGFDGSHLETATAIREHLASIFADHRPATYTAVVDSVRFLTPHIALLCGLAGMIPPNQTAFKPELNTVHTLLAIQTDGTWLATLFQATPAAWHGRPQDVSGLVRRLAAVHERGLTTA